MNNQSTLISNYLNHAIVESQLKKAKDYALDLSVVKFELKFEPSEGQKFKHVVSFIHSYLEFIPIIYEGGNTFVLFLQEYKIHAAVMTIKNLILSIKLKFNVEIKNLAITSCEDSDNINTLTQRVHTLFMKSKVSKTKDIVYGTKEFEFNTDENQLEKIKAVFTQYPNVSIYGFYKEIPLINKTLIDYCSHSTTRVTIDKKNYAFIKKQSFVYIEHYMIPSIMRADIIKTNDENQTIELDHIIFLDNSPLHRKNIRITPHKSIHASLEREGEIHIEGIIGDISKNSILLETQLAKVEELTSKNLQNFQFKLSFQIENLTNIPQELSMKATIYKTSGNTLILNIFPNSFAQTHISEYITMCQSLLLREVLQEE